MNNFLPSSEQHGDLRQDTSIKIFLEHLCSTPFGTLFSNNQKDEIVMELLEYIPDQTLPPVGDQRIEMW